LQKETNRLRWCSLGDAPRFKLANAEAAWRWRAPTERVESGVRKLRELLRLSKKGWTRRIRSET
jgi:hypothetical protein